MNSLLPGVPGTVRRREGHFEADRQQTDRHHQTRDDQESEEKRKFEGKQQTEYHAADQRGCCVEIAFQDHGDGSRQDVADHAASDGGEYSAKDDAGESEMELKPLLCAQSREYPESDGVADLDDVPETHPVFCREEDQESRRDADQNILFILERGYRDGADDTIPHDSAADSDAAGQNGDSEHIQTAPYALDRAGYGEDQSAE
ncbi:hypothetical protein SDC9_181184 [bioreactor metagenome]|uniref:Uncharacterized protein n=1 Tax=bioreactor metagenome TaxID=1076179 RepID=A0A645HD42_9ZZZZ